MPIRLYLSYAREDRSLLNRLQEQLSRVDPLRLIEISYIRDISEPLTDDSASVYENLEQAHIVALLITPRFLQSDYVESEELRRALTKHRKSELLLVPVLMRSAVWKTGALAELKPLPQDEIAVLALSDSEGAMRELAASIKVLAEERVPRRRLIADAQPQMIAVGHTMWDSWSQGEYCYIPPGSFVMGRNYVPPFWLQLLTLDVDSGERPPHKVSITQGFWFGKCPVTQRQWEQVMGTYPSRYVGGERPVEGISWNDTQEFLRRLNNRSTSSWRYRLPTEAEWEYAARAGTTHPSYGLNPSDTAWFNCADTQPVGTKLPNPWGLCDILGNVWEWCSDWSDFGLTGGYYAISPASDPQGPPSGSFRILRGSAFYGKAVRMRVTLRNYGLPSGTERGFGMRCVMVQKALR